MKNLKQRKIALKNLNQAESYLSHASTLIEQAMPYISKYASDQKSLRKVSLDAMGHASYLARVIMLGEWQIKKIKKSA